MTSINNLNSYYQLANALTGQQGNSSSGGNALTGNNGTSSTTQSLLDALNGATGGSQDNSAYSLNLSSAAQQLIGGGSSSSSASQDFTLTNSQKKTIEGILEQFADKPFTQDTYNQIQEALQKAGVSANQLMAHDMIVSTSAAPTQTLLNALNGDFSAPVTKPTDMLSSEKTKASNYMDEIVKEWQSLSAAITADPTSQG